MTVCHMPTLHVVCAQQKNNKPKGQQKRCRRMNMHPVSCFNACVKVGYFESAKGALVPPVKSTPHKKWVKIFYLKTKTKKKQRTNNQKSRWKHEQLRIKTTETKTTTTTSVSRLSARRRIEIEGRAKSFLQH